MLIRPETEADFATLRELELAAFAPSELEAEIVDALPAIRGLFRYADAFG